MQVNREKLASELKTEIARPEWQGYVTYCDQVLGGFDKQCYDIEHELILEDESYVDTHFLQLVANSFVQDTFKAFRLFHAKTLQPAS